MARSLFACGKANRYYPNGRKAPWGKHSGGHKPGTVIAQTKDGPKEVTCTSQLNRPEYFRKQIEREQRKRRGFFGRMTDRIKRLVTES